MQLICLKSFLNKNDKALKIIIYNEYEKFSSSDLVFFGQNSIFAAW